MKVAECESVQEEAAGNIRMMASDKAPRVKRMPDHLRSLFNDARVHGARRSSVSATTSP